VANFQNGQLRNGGTPKGKGQEAQKQNEDGQGLKEGEPVMPRYEFKATYLEGRDNYDKD